MDADWVGTDQALHYVHFNARHADSWLWSGVHGADLVRRGLVFARVRVRLDNEESHVLSLGRQAANSLLAIVAERAGTGPDSW